MANPQRAMDPRHDDPVITPPVGPDPLDPRLKPAANEAFSNQNMYREGFGGTALLIAAILLALAVVSYFVFSPSGVDRPLPPDRHAASEPVNPSGSPSSAPSTSGASQRMNPSGSSASSPSGNSGAGPSTAPAQGSQPTQQPAQPAPAQ